MRVEGNRRHRQDCRARRHARPFRIEVRPCYLAMYKRSLDLGRPSSARRSPRSAAASRGCGSTVRPISGRRCQRWTASDTVSRSCDAPRRSSDRVSRRECGRSGDARDRRAPGDRRRDRATGRAVGLADRSELRGVRGCDDAGRGGGSRGLRSPRDPAQHPNPLIASPTSALNPRIFPSPIPTPHRLPPHQPLAASINARTDLPCPERHH